MASRDVVCELVGWRDRRGRFTRATRRASERMRGGALRSLAKLKRAAIDESPTGRGERPAGIRFKDGWRTGFVPTADGGIGTLTNVAPHAGFVIFPTPEHDIVAVNAKVLRFEAGGDVIFRKRVHHLGTKGNDIPGRVLGASGAGFEQELRRVAVQVLADIRDVWA